MSTAIAWTNETWNPVTGCSHVSEGCRNCYAETLSLRHGWSKNPWTARNAAENVQIHVDRLDQPLRWRKPRRVFVNSMSDLFHEQVPEEYVAEVFGVMAVAAERFQGPGDGYRLQRYEPTGEVLAHWPKMKHGPHTFQILTKRADRMRVMLGRPSFVNAVASAAYRHANNRTCAGGLSDDIERGTLWPLPNVWLGVSVEDQQNADERIPLLLETPAAVRFLSCEPLLGPIDLEYPATLFPDGPPMCCSSYQSGIASCGCRGLPVEPPLMMSLSGARIDWVIAGGESGHGYRPMDVAWARLLKDQCAAADVPFFMKQDSGSRPGKQGRIPDELWVQEFPQTREPVPA